MTNIKKLSGLWNKKYYEVNREERNHCAILYHLLLQGNNLETFLKLIRCEFKVDAPEIYFEYAFIRDIWDTLEDNEQKKNIILEILNPSNKNELEEKDVSDFNDFFISRTSSKNKIESPSNWNVEKIDASYPKNEEFIEICKFKWCFNAKPDLVIHTSQDTAVCIECKLESGEGMYPSNSNEKKIFKDRNIDGIKQTKIQEKIMKILGFKSQSVLIAKTGEYTWKNIFATLDTSNIHPFISNWLKDNIFIK